MMDRKRKTQSAAAANGVDVAAWATDLRTLQDIVGKFRDMSIDQTEFACLKGIVIFRTGIVNILSIYTVQKQYKYTWNL